MVDSTRLDSIFTIFIQLIDIYFELIFISSYTVGILILVVYLP